MAGTWVHSGLCCNGASMALVLVVMTPEERKAHPLHYFRDAFAYLCNSFAILAATICFIVVIVVATAVFVRWLWGLP